MNATSGRVDASLGIDALFAHDFIPKRGRGRSRMASQPFLPVGSVSREAQESVDRRSKEIIARFEQEIVERRKAERRVPDVEGAIKGWDERVALSGDPPEIQERRRAEGETRSRRASTSARAKHGSSREMSFSRLPAERS